MLDLTHFKVGKLYFQARGKWIIYTKYPLCCLLVVQGVAQCRAHALNTEETVCTHKNRQVFQTWVLTVCFTFYPKSK